MSKLTDMIDAFHMQYGDPRKEEMGKELAKIKSEITRLEEQKITIGRDHLAKEMHNEYERLAIKAGWNTQEKCKVEFEQLPEANKSVMLDMADFVITRLEAKPLEFKWVDEHNEHESELLYCNEKFVGGVYHNHSGYVFYLNAPTRFAKCARFQLETLDSAKSTLINLIISNRSL